MIIKPAPLVQHDPRIQRIGQQWVAQMGVGVCTPSPCSVGDDERVRVIIQNMLFGWCGGARFCDAIAAELNVVPLVLEEMD